MKRQTKVLFVIFLVSITVFALLLNRERKNLVLDEFNEFVHDVGDVIDNNEDLSTESKKEFLVTNSSKELKQLKDKISKESGVFGLYIKDLKNNEEYKINSEEPFDGLSLFKIPLAYATAKKIEKGDLEWGQSVTYAREDYVDGIGAIGSYAFGTEFILEEVLELLLRESDNTAQRVLKNLIEEDYIKGEIKELLDNPNTTFYDDRIVTPIMFSSVIEKIFYTNRISQENRDRLLSFMYPTSYDTQISPYLSKNLTFYHKVGISDDMFHNCGVIKNDSGDKEIIVCLMSRNTNLNSYINVCKLVGEFLNAM